MTTVEEWDWNSVEQAVETLTLSVKGRNFVPDYIFALSRGGLIPAALLEDSLNLVSDIYTIPITHYPKSSSNPNGNIKIGELPNDFYYVIEDKSILLVDDLIDKGTTLNTIMPYFKKAREVLVVVLAQKSLMANIPANVSNILSAVGTKPSTWIVFPWERNEFKGMIK